jgi:hypothetical protein
MVAPKMFYVNFRKDLYIVGKFREFSKVRFWVKERELGLLSKFSFTEKQLGEGHFASFHDFRDDWIDNNNGDCVQQSCWQHNCCKH